MRNILVGVIVCFVVTASSSDAQQAAQIGHTIPFELLARANQMIR